MSQQTTAAYDADQAARGPAPDAGGVPTSGADGPETAAAASRRIRVELLPDEGWWGGAVADGQAMPLGGRAHRRDLSRSAGRLDDDTAGANQSAPLLVSDRGRWIWSEHPFEYAFDGAGTLEVDGTDVVVGSGGETLRDAFRAAAAVASPSAERGAPSIAMFSAPQYNTWIELPYHPTQQGVLDYARGVLAAGFPPGLLMIDDKWSVDYGTWTFDRAAFPDPAAMCRELHDLGFTVMVWLVPFLSPDSETSRLLAGRGWLVRGADGREVVRDWWNGWSTLLDLTHPDGLAWIRGELAALRELGVDGFKFDAGDLRDYRPGDVTVGGGGGVEQCEAWARLAAEFDVNELRACWKMAGRPLAQRLHDKPCAWGEDGLLSLIPEGIAQGLIGHPYTCPDMIGGGELVSFQEGAVIDQELFVRFAQCSALFPMMQFSLAPWRVLDPEPFAAVRAAVELRQSLWPELQALIAEATRTGEPILRPLAYHHEGYRDVRDQFLLGEDLLVAPVLEQGATSRTVSVPPGRWRDPSGATVEGPTTVVLPVDLQSLPWWRRVDPSA